jgi:hypothetical protein
MAAKLRLQYTVPDSTARRMMTVPGDMMIRALPAFIAQKHQADVDTALVSGCILNEDEPLDAFYESPNQIFAFSKSANRSITATSGSSGGRPGSALPPLHPKPRPVEQPLSACVGDFRGLREHSGRSSYLKIQRCTTRLQSSSSSERLGRVPGNRISYSAKSRL